MEKFIAKYSKMWGAIAGYLIAGLIVTLTDADAAEFEGKAAVLNGMVGHLVQGLGTAYGAFKFPKNL